MYRTNLQKQTPTLLLILSMEGGCSSAYSINLNIVPNLNKDYHQISINHDSYSRYHRQIPGSGHPLGGS